MQPLSLVHLVREPIVEVRNPPLLLLLHGVGSNEYDLFGLAPYLDERFLIISVRAQIRLGREAMPGLMSISRRRGRSLTRLRPRPAVKR